VKILKSCFVYLPLTCPLWCGITKLQNTERTFFVYVRLDAETSVQIVYQLLKYRYIKVNRASITISSTQYVWLILWSRGLNHQALVKTRSTWSTSMRFKCIRIHPSQVMPAIYFVFFCYVMMLAAQIIHYCYAFSFCIAVSLLVTCHNQI